MHRKDFDNDFEEVREQAIAQLELDEITCSKERNWDVRDRDE